LNEQTPQRSGWWAWLRRPSSKYSLLTLLALGFAAGIVFWGGFNTVVAATNTQQFCISCHVMYANVYKEYVGTIHHTNRTGVRATCADCHVPREWVPKMVRKVQSTRELYGWVLGTIDTPEKFAAERLRLARREWRRMEANDSLECRNCHTMEAMNTEKQTPRARRMHEQAVRNNETCIACHKGVAHNLPEGMTEEDE